MILRQLLKKKHYTKFWFLFFSKKGLMPLTYNRFIIGSSEISFFFRMANLFIFFKKVIALHNYKIKASHILFFQDHMYFKSNSSSRWKKSTIMPKLITPTATGFAIFNSLIKFPFAQLYTLKRKHWICVGYSCERFFNLPIDYNIPIDCIHFFNIYFLNLLFIKYFIKN